MILKVSVMHTLHVMHIPPPPVQRLSLGGGGVTAHVELVISGRDASAEMIHQGAPVGQVAARPVEGHAQIVRAVPIPGQDAGGVELSLAVEALIAGKFTQQTARPVTLRHI